ncbi:MAG: SRPBCC family protein [Vitreoscilla sp.]
MAASNESESGSARNRTTSERRSDREMVVTRTFDAPARLVFEAWTTPDLFKQWWVPKSSGATLLSCAQDVRVGGSYRLEFAHPQGGAPMGFFGRYLEVVPDTRLVWTNEESADGAVTTVTFEEKDGRTLLVMSELYPSKQALEIAIEGMDEAMPETFEQLDEFLLARGAGAQAR